MSYQKQSSLQIKKELQDQMIIQVQNCVPQNYQCICGRNYLSYAAVYTHVKLKHQGDKNYLNDIIKPFKPKLKRGRPMKNQGSSYSDCESEKLCLIQELILQIFKDLTTNLSQQDAKLTLLKNNEQNSLDKLLEEHAGLIKSYGNPGTNYLLNQNLVQAEDISEFLKRLLKHFRIKQSSKLLWIINRILSLRSQNISSELDTNFHDIWGYPSNIFELIEQSLTKWLQISKREKIEENSTGSS